MKKLLTIITVAALISTGSMAHAMGDKQCKGKRGNGEARLQQMQAKLDLTDEQVTQIRDIRTTHRENMEATYQKPEPLNLTDLDPSSDEYQAAVAEHAQMKSDYMEAKMIGRGQMKAEIFAILTEEQQEKFKALKKERGKKW